MIRKTFLLLLVLSLVLITSCAGSTNSAIEETESSINVCERGWVKSIFPEDLSQNVSFNSNIIITVNEGLDVTHISDRNFIVTGPDGDLEGTVSKDRDSNTITFIADSGLPSLSNIFVTAYNSQCEEDKAVFSSEFLTGSLPDTLSPEIVSFSPSDGSSEITLNPEIRVIFSEDINPSILNGSVLLMGPDGFEILVELDYDAANKMLIIIPGVELNPLTRYSLVIKNIKDNSENIIQTQSISFTTGELPDYISPNSIEVSIKAFTRGTLQWVASGDDEDLGVATRYELKFSDYPIETENDYAIARSIIGLPVPEQAGEVQEFILPSMTVGDYYFVLRIYDDAGNVSDIVDSSITIQAVDTILFEPVEDHDLNDYSGKSITGNCDINNDGLDDLLVGSPRDDIAGTDTGRVFIYFGRSDQQIENEDVLIINGIDSHDSSANDYFGHSVSCGDFNADGFDDIIVGAPLEDTSNGITYAGNSGAVYLFYGSDSLYEALDMNADQADLIFRGRYSSNYFGMDVAMLGDINGDGFEDLGIVENLGDYLQTNEGIAYVFYGEDYESGSSLYDIHADIIIRGEASGARISGIVAAGDIDGDGVLDIALSTDTYPLTKEGSVYILLGKNGYDELMYLADRADIILRGANANDYLGGDLRLGYFDNSLSINGDINNDGYDDIVVGAPYFGASDIGRVYVIFGRENIEEITGLEDADVIIDGKYSSDFFGYSLDTNGDFNNDGIDDLFVTASGFDNGDQTNHGGGFIFFGSTRWNEELTWLNADVIIGAESGILENVGFSESSISDGFGKFGAFIGDTNADGYDDVAIGSRDIDFEEIANVGAWIIIR